MTLSVPPVQNAPSTHTPNTAAWDKAKTDASQQGAIQHDMANGAVMVLGQLGLQLISNLQQEESDLSSN